MIHLTTPQLAERWHMSKKTLCMWRVTGHGPRFMKIGQRVLYPMSEIESFEKASLKANTQQASTVTNV